MVKYLGKIIVDGDLVSPLGALIKKECGVDVPFYPLKDGEDDEPETPRAHSRPRRNGSAKRGKLPGGGGRQFVLDQVIEHQAEGLSLKYLEAQFVRYGYSRNNASCRLSELYGKNWNPEGPLIEQRRDGRYYPTPRGLKVRKAPEPPPRPE